MLVLKQKYRFKFVCKEDPESIWCSTLRASSIDVAIARAWFLFGHTFSASDVEDYDLIVTPCDG